MVDYERFCRFLEQSCGIVLGPGKMYLVSSRLAPLLREQGLSGLGELVQRLESGRSRALRVAVVDAMTTNETLWFRDGHPFELLKEEVLERLSGPRAGPVRIWSAACSTGQEPYSISMAVQECNEKSPGRLPAGVEIIATDISPSVLKQAREGIYEELELRRGLSPERRQRFFRDLGDGRMQVREDIRRRVTFRELNLLQSYVGLGRLDVVFLRNVLIYFSHENKSDILRRVAQALRPPGYLFLGGSEPMASYSDAFEMVRCRRGVVYRLKEGAGGGINARGR
ncbi:MAG: protein-glutamate O-methyltransferase CheR [Gammaproteobacteria bacterium]|nr:MAG: protein-glutamate O-methyltransferase CheR [Gammaproteobacteria bacterium]